MVIKSDTDYLQSTLSTALVPILLLQCLITTDRLNCKTTSYRKLDSCSEPALLEVCTVISFLSA